MSGLAFDSCENLWRQDAVIPINDYLSDGIFTEGHAIVGILMPAAWTAAKLGFQVSLDGVNWYDVKDSGGNFEQSVAGASTFIAIPIADAISSPHIRLKSVDAANAAVNQAAARTITVVMKRFLGGS